MEMNRHAVHWAEIPAADFARAKRFYETIFAFEMPQARRGALMLGFLPFDQGKGIGAAIVHGPGYVPAAHGPVVYLGAGQDLSVVLHRVVTAGGLVVAGKGEIAPGLGFSALFQDCEGNRLGLHSPR
jgi:predicted enzyme related to lactoylglutathione lyase